MILNSKSIYYEDVNLIAQPTSVKSRKHIPKELWRIMATPMSSVVGDTFTKKALDLGISVGIHRFCSAQERLSKLSFALENCAHENNKENLWVAIGLNDRENIPALIEHGMENIILDIANGYMLHTIDYMKEIVKSSGNKIKKIMMGNIHSSSMLTYFTNMSEDLGMKIWYRCGIAGGSACNTRGMTGINRGPITEIIECTDWQEQNSGNLGLVADGGIKDPACAAKAFGAGAEMLLIGGYFSKAKEAQNIIDGKYTFWGGASNMQQVLQYGEVKRHSEGKELAIDPNNTSTLEDLVNDLWGGISSAVSYSGYDSLEKFIKNGVFEIK